MLRLIGLSWRAHSSGAAFCGRGVLLWPALGAGLEQVRAKAGAGPCAVEVYAYATWGTTRPFLRLYFAGLWPAGRTKILLRANIKNALHQSLRGTEYSAGSFTDG